MSAVNLNNNLLNFTFMSYTLEPLKVSNLTLLEVGQLINRHQQDIGLLDNTLITDPPLKNYLTTLFTQNTTYTQGLMKIQKDEKTELLENDDWVRDKAVTTFGKAIRLSLDSDDEAEVAAAKSITLLLDTYKDITLLPYEAETLAVDKLVAALESSEYSSKVNAINGTKYVARIKSANEAFKAHFSDRSTAEALTENTVQQKSTESSARLLRRSLHLFGIDDQRLQNGSVYQNAGLCQRRA
jgi:hypothetical protein